jgi:ABC-2 type transport system ATP-binding protein
VNIVELESVEKRYGEVVALRSTTLTLKSGRIGLLGPNGSGKSTLIKILLGLVRPEHGRVRVFDTDVLREPRSARARIGYMPEGDAVLPFLSAVDATTLAAELAGLPSSEASARAHQVLHYVGLGEARYRLLGSFSTGMKQRARLAQALVGAPSLLLLDEPTSGLDPRGRDEMLELVQDIPARTGASVILSTHILPDVEKICDQVVVLAGGELIHSGRLSDLLANDDPAWQVRVKGSTQPLRGPLEAAGCRVAGDDSTLDVHLPIGSKPELILRVANEAGLEIRHVAPLTMTLERAFFDTLEKNNHGKPEGASASP